MGIIGRTVWGGNEEKGCERMTEQCESCPECVVLFDDAGYHGCKPDPNSPICKMCMDTDKGDD